MSKITAAITALGGYVPETRLTNFDLEKMVATNDEWIKTRTGISERRILKTPNTATSDLAVPAILELLRKKDLDPKEIDCIICATVTPDMLQTMCVQADPCPHRFAFVPSDLGIQVKSYFQELLVSQFAITNA